MQPAGLSHTAAGLGRVSPRTLPVISPRSWLPVHFTCNDMVPKISAAAFLGCSLPAGFLKLPTDGDFWGNKRVQEQLQRWLYPVLGGCPTPVPAMTGPHSTLLSFVLLQCGLECPPEAHV